jgi:peptide/nickel transport system permease protein
MGALIARRLISVVPILLIVTFGVFLLVNLGPGDPAVNIAGGVSATPQAVAEVRHELHLDEPLVQQYGRWLSGAVQGDFGTSYTSHEPVATEIGRALPVTIGLVLAGMTVALLVGIPLGLISGMRAGSRADTGARVYASIGLAIPEFVLAVVLVFVVAVEWGILPPSGFVHFSDSPTEWLRYMALPALALGLVNGAMLSRQLRASLIDTMDSNYVRAAWAQGGSARNVVGKHALKNSAIPVVTLLGTQLGFLIGGTVLLEQIFAIPGMGPYMLRSITTQDLPAIQGVTVVFVIFGIAISLLVDITYGFLNPKVRVY